MSADQQRQFPGWNVIYRQQAIETMPWFYPELDDDLRHAQDRLGLWSGAALDLGSGPGTQAMQLARRGFAVTAVDISEAAIRSQLQVQSIEESVYQSTLDVLPRALFCVLQKEITR